MPADDTFTEQRVLPYSVLDERGVPYRVDLRIEEFPPPARRPGIDTAGNPAGP